MGTSEMRFDGAVPEVDPEGQQGNKAFQSMSADEDLKGHVQWNQPSAPQRMSLFPWFVPFEPGNDPFVFEDTLQPYNYVPVPVSNALYAYETKSPYANEAPFGTEVNIPHVGEKAPLKKLEAISRTKQRQRLDPGVTSVSAVDDISLKQLIGIHDVKQRQKQEVETKVVMTESPTAKTPQSPPVEATRLKLRDSLTSALQIVDSSQISNGDLDPKADGGVDGATHAQEHKNTKAAADKGDVETEYCEDVGGLMDAGAEGGAAAHFQQDFCGPDGEVKLEVDLSTMDAATEPALTDADVEMKDHSEMIMAEVELLQKRVVEQARKVAVSIESQLYLLFGGVNKKYREKARSLLFNLKDKNNPELRARVFSGEITPEALCNMTAEDLASKELSEWRTAKAEELAHMVVLTDADVDPRFIVKKTHKGEFQVVVEKDVQDVVPTAELTANRHPQSKPVNKEANEVRKDSATDELPQPGKQPSVVVGSPTPVVDAGVGKEDQDTEMVESEAVLETVDPNLPAIPSMDDFQESRDAAVDQKSVEKVAEPEKPSEPTPPQMVWHGSLQTNTSKLTPVRVFFRSGEKADLTEWSKVIEVKGRVKLAALTKFLQELQSSRSRSVMVLSVCKHEEQVGSSAANLLSEVAEQYRTGERVGYAEPSPGFELYLLPPGNDTTKLLAEHGHPQNSSGLIGEGEELLMGVVVWRKNQLQSSVPSRGPNQNNKRVAFSGKSSVSPSQGEASKSGITFSRKGSASSAAHVSHGLSMQKHVESAPSTRTPVRDSFRHSPSVTNSVNYQQHHVVPLAGVKGAEERSSSSTAASAAAAAAAAATAAASSSSAAAAAGLSKESSRQQTNLPSRRANDDNDLADVPPGFFPGPSPAFSFAPDAASRGQSGSSAGAAPTSATPSPLSNLSVHADPRVSQHVTSTKKDDELMEAPPGFWPRGPRAHRASSPTDEDDLPEFDFDSQRGIVGAAGQGQQVAGTTSSDLALNSSEPPNQFGVEVPKEQSLLNSAGVPVFTHPSAAASRYYTDLHNAPDFTSASPAAAAAAASAFNNLQTPAAASAFSQQRVAGSALDQRFLGGNQPQTSVTIASLPLTQDVGYLNAAAGLPRHGGEDHVLMRRDSQLEGAGSHMSSVAAAGQSPFGVTDAAAAASLQYAAARSGVLNQQLRNGGALSDWRAPVPSAATSFQGALPGGLPIIGSSSPGVFAAPQQRFTAVDRARTPLPTDSAWVRAPPAPQQLLPEPAPSSRPMPTAATSAVGAVGTAGVGAAAVGAVGMPKWQHPNQFQRTIYATRKPVEIKDTAAALRQREILNARDAYPGRSADPYSATRTRDPRKLRRERSRSRDRGRSRGRSRDRSRSRDRGRSRSKDRHRDGGTRQKDKDSSRGRERERDRSRSRSRGRSRERSRERSNERSTERNRERSRERERDCSPSPKSSK